MKFSQGNPCWMQVDLNNFETGTNFFTNALGWEIPPGNPELGGYSMATINGKPVSGVWPAANSPVPQPDTIDVWLSSDDIEETLRRVIELGGIPLDMDGGHVQEIMDLGYQAMFTDPVGGLTGIWQAKSFAGIEAFNLPGGPCWIEYLTDNVAGAGEFYAAAFDLDAIKHSDDYWVMQSRGSDEDAFGITNPVPGVKDGWIVSIYTEDIRADLDRIIRAGGHAKGEPFEVEGMGKYCFVTTPAGVDFGLFEIFSDPVAQ